MVPVSKNRIRLAIQKSGRLADRSRQLLSASGLRIRSSGQELYLRVANQPVDLLLVRDDDISGFVNDGVCDLGIVGGNVFEEFCSSHQNPKVVVKEALGFSNCRLAIALPEGQSYEGARDLAGKRIATTYRGILSAFLAENNVDADIVDMRGAVELAPRLGIADAICDIVSTGATLEANGLVDVETVFNSEALLIQSGDQLPPEKQAILDRLLPRFRGVLASGESKYIMLNAPASSLGRITDLLPGADAPTVIPLEGLDDMYAVQSVCRESVFWETMEDLKDAGATSILVLPIEKMLE